MREALESKVWIKTFIIPNSGRQIVAHALVCNPCKHLNIEKVDCL